MDLHVWRCDLYRVAIDLENEQPSFAPAIVLELVQSSGILKKGKRVHQVFDSIVSLTDDIWV